MQLLFIIIHIMSSFPFDSFSFIDMCLKLLSTPICIPPTSVSRFSENHWYPSKLILYLLFRYVSTKQISAVFMVLMISLKLCYFPFTPLLFKCKTWKNITFFYFVFFSYLLLHQIAESVVLLIWLNAVHLLQISCHCLNLFFMKNPFFH